MYVAVRHMLNLLTTRATQWSSRDPFVPHSHPRCSSSDRARHRDQFNGTPTRLNRLSRTFLQS